MFVLLKEGKTEVRHVGVVHTTNSYTYLVIDGSDYCSRYNAVKDTSKGTTHTCRCNYKEIFFARSGEEPKCQGDKYGRVYGMFI